MNIQPTQHVLSSLSAKTTPDRDTGSATPVSCISSATCGPSQNHHQPRLSLRLRGPNLPGIPDVEVELTSSPLSNITASSQGDCTILQAVQSLVQISALGSKVLIKL